MWILTVALAVAAGFQTPSGAVVEAWRLPETTHGRGACEAVLWADATGEVGVELGSCPATLAPAVLAAAEAWRFVPAPEQPVRRVPVLFTVDEGGAARVGLVPGPDKVPGGELPAGVGIVEPPRPREEIVWTIKPGTRMPKVGDGCAFFFEVSPGGRATPRGDVGCESDLVEQVVNIAQRADWVPGSVLGVPVTTTARLELYFLDDQRVKERRLAYAFDAMPAPIRVAGGLSARAAQVPAGVFPDAICEATVLVVGAGVSEVNVEGCDGPLRDAVVVAARRWRFVAPDHPTQVMVPFVAGRDGVRAAIVSATDAAGPFKDRFLELELPRVKKSGALTWPAAAAEAPASGVTCRYLVSVDTEGRATQVDTTRCPEPFQEDNAQKIAGWTFTAATAGGRPIPSRWAIGLVYRPPLTPAQTITTSSGPKLAQSEALFRFPQADIGFLAFEPPVAPVVRSKRLVYCEVVFEVGSGLPPQIRWCDGDLAAEVERAANTWRFTPVEAPVRRSLAVYVEPSGDVDVVVWGRAPDDGPWPFDVTYGEAPRPKRILAPGWPKDADRAVGQVTCVVRGRVLLNGRLVDPAPPECPAAFAAVALSKLRTWRFEPAVVDGQARPAEYAVRIVFRP